MARLQEKLQESLIDSSRVRAAAARRCDYRFVDCVHATFQPRSRLGRFQAACLTKERATLSAPTVRRPEQPPEYAAIAASDLGESVVNTAMETDDAMPALPAATLQARGFPCPRRCHNDVWPAPSDV